MIADLPEDKKKQILTDFRKVSWRISDLYLNLIRSLEKSYPDVKCIVVHERDTELCEAFFRERTPHIERNKILRMITACQIEWNL